MSEISPSAPAIPDPVLASFGTETGGLKIYNWAAAGTVWVDFPVAGFTGLGTGGPGGNPWIATVTSKGNWFADSQPGDLAYRNTHGALLLGATRDRADLKIVSGGGQVIVDRILTVRGILQSSNESVAASGTDAKSARRLTCQYTIVTAGAGGVMLPNVDNAIYWINNLTDEAVTVYTPTGAHAGEAAANNVVRFFLASLSVAFPS
jgi:hypothetical protein